MFEEATAAQPPKLTTGLKGCTTGRKRLYFLVIAQSKKAKEATTAIQFFAFPKMPPQASDVCDRTDGVGLDAATQRANMKEQKKLSGELMQKTCLLKNAVLSVIACLPFTADYWTETTDKLRQG